ncbi:RNA-binding domain-containing protein [Hesseltinella vesiculosa]|uniref:RNA-binding domain-containing protein n=1 Tax=Hesseltinella vesiculosa TaxID=101127 RepID=A0A1X2GAM0_9FUNG|nr:RNA-binding domain-containing protein [Hesseltinella vesiculosa]
MAPPPAPIGVGIRGVPVGLPVSKQVLNTTPCRTVYVSNLNEKIKLQEMKDALRDLFKKHGEVLDIVAHANIRLRGQAFVAYPTIEDAEKAIKELQHHVLFNKPMVVQFARNKSDIHAKDDGDFDEHKRKRLEKKGESMEKAALAKHKARTVNAKAVPEEYLPPNNILFIQQLSSTVTQDDLTKLFEKYAGFKEVRTIPVKKDIAFVEYDNDYQASLAKMELSDHVFEDGSKFKLTFARK